MPILWSVSAFFLVIKTSGEKGEMLLRRGVRQGDFFSPKLFIAALEADVSTSEKGI